ncbi:MAG TPA: tripartite tricarboxylate transporter TctB family protein [Micropepsaceae bacterium]|nr:tripartite tricarboxylate transporter TctB family protein [Micropepsaceae bacterium]
MRKDFVSAAILLCIAAAYYAVSTTIPSSTLEDGVGPRGLPVVLSALLAMVAIAIGVRAAVTAPVSAEAEKDAEAPWPRAIGMLVIGALYIPVATLVGYWLALLLLLLAASLYEGMKPSWRMLAVAVGGATFFFLLFDVLLGVRVPQGLLF